MYGRHKDEHFIIYTRRGSTKDTQHLKRERIKVWNQWDKRSCLVVQDLETHQEKENG